MAGTARGWVHEGSLRPFLAAVSLFLRYDFDADDWNAIRCGLDGTCTSKGVWFDYEFSGRVLARLKVGFDEPGTSVVDFEINLPEDLVPKVDAAAEIVNAFDVGLREA